jgi:hypothetical protein
LDLTFVGLIFLIISMMELDAKGCVERPNFVLNY